MEKYNFRLIDAMFNSEIKELQNGFDSKYDVNHCWNLILACSYFLQQKSISTSQGLSKRNLKRYSNINAVVGTY